MDIINYSRYALIIQNNHYEIVAGVGAIYIPDDQGNRSANLCHRRRNAKLYTRERTHFEGGTMKTQYTKIINVHPPYRPSYELAITFEKPFDEVALCCALCEDLFVDIEKVGEEVLAKHFFRLIKKSMPKYADALYSVEINNYNGYIVTVLKEDETEDETWESNCVGGFES